MELEIQQNPSISIYKNFFWRNKESWILPVHNTVAAIGSSYVTSCQSFSKLILAYFQDFLQDT